MWNELAYQRCLRTNLRLHLRPRRLKLRLLLLRPCPVVLQEREAVRQQPVVMLPAEQRFHAELLQCQHQPDALAQERAQRPVEDKSAADGNDEGRCQHPAIGVWRAGNADKAKAEARDHTEPCQPVAAIARTGVSTRGCT